MRNLVMGTAGHIDHGKTSLVKALTGINTDTLKEEQQRGITVNLGFSYLKLTEEHTVGMVDVPGHERLIKNMLAGVCGIDFILLTIAADDGIMPQTKEHMEIIQFLNIKNIIVVITKVDLASRERIEEVKQSVRDTFQLNDFVEFSIHQEHTVQDVKQMILDSIKSEQELRDEPYRMSVDRVFTVKGQGVVITGTSLSGIVRIGDELEILPSKQRVRVRGIQSFNQPRTKAYKRMRVALNLGGVKKDDLKRGMILATKGVFTPSSIIDVKIKVAHELSKPIKNLETVKLYYLANEMKCRIKLINRKQLSEGEVIYGQLLLDEAIFATNKDLGILRRINPNETIAGIEMVNVFGEYVNRYDESYTDTLKLFDDDAIDSLVHQYIDQHSFISLNELKNKLHLLHLSDEELLEIVKAKSIVLDDLTCITEFKFKELENKLIALLTDYHQEHPLEHGMNKQACQQGLKLDYLSNKTFNQFLSMVSSVKVMHDQVKLTSFTIKYNREEQLTVKSIMDCLNSFEFKPPTLNTVLDQVRGKNVKGIYFSLIKEKALIKVDQEIVLTQSLYEEMMRRLDLFFQENQILMINDMRDILNTSRKYTIAYLEYCDKIGYTRRTEEGRVKKE
jgi:selenocysteine-specific elongation factor